MTAKHLISALAALLVLAACVCAVSASTFKVTDVSLANYNEQKDIALSLDSAPAGVSGYYVTFTIDPPIAKIVGVKYPADWIDPMFVTNSAGPNNPFNVFMEVADVKNGIRASPATDIYLGSVTVQGVSPGTAHITVHADQVDDEYGNAINPPDGTGSITVATPPGSIQVTSIPPGAEIYVNDVDRHLTTTPGNNIVNDLIPGYYSVKVTLPGYVDSVQPAVLVISGETTQVPFTLGTAGTASVTSVPAGASILIDGVLQQDVVTNHDFTNIVPGPHPIQVNLKDYYPKSLKKTVYASKTTVYTFSLTKIPPNEIELGPPWGTIDVDSTPPGAQVYIDGVAVAGMETPGWTNIEAKPHTVYVTLKDHVTPDPQTVDVIKGETYYLKFPLVKITNVPVKVKIVPRTLNLASNGVFVAFITLPSSYKAADVDAKSVICEGAPALRLVRVKWLPQIFVAIFSREKLVNVKPGEDVKFTVTGTINKNGQPVQFSGSDSIKVMSKKVTTKDEYEDAMTWSDTKILSKG